MGTRRVGLMGPWKGLRPHSVTAARGAVLIALIACVNERGERPRTDTVAADTAPDVLAPDVAASTTPCPSGARYELSDTSGWATMIEEGKRAVLRGDGALIDTVDAGFGVHALGRDTLVFLPVLAYEVDSAEAAGMAASAASPDEYVLCAPTGRHRLSALLPHFNSGFSSPSVVDSTLYYWGLHRVDDRGRYRLLAMRYSARTNRVDSLFLREETPATDFRYFYTPPFEEQGSIIFEGGEARAVIDPAAWRVVRVEQRPPR